MLCSTNKNFLPLYFLSLLLSSDDRSYFLVVNADERIARLGSNGRNKRRRVPADQSSVNRDVHIIEINSNIKVIFLVSYLRMRTFILLLFFLINSNTCILYLNLILIIFVNEVTAILVFTTCWYAPLLLLWKLIVVYIQASSTTTTKK